MPVANNNRIFYACQAVAIKPMGSTAAATVVHGVQSVGINTTFNLEQVFELGQIHIYENIEGVPDVEVTLEKVLDGYPLMLHLASSTVQSDSALTTPSAKTALVARAKQRCDVILGIFPDTVEHIGNTNDPAQSVYMSGMYISSIGYTIPVDGNCTESLTLVGNHKAWNVAGNLFTGAVAKTLGTVASNVYTDTPKNLQGSPAKGGIQRRENVSMSLSALPASIAGASGVGNGYDSSKKIPKVHIQNINISCDLNRESVQELGRKAPYTRYANFPVEVTCEFEVIAVSGDMINATEAGPYAVGNINYGNNTAEEFIKIVLHDGTTIDLGTKNRLSSVNYTGGDAGGGNATITYSYSTFNNLSVYHPEDPATGARLSGSPTYNAP
jgi:hypothetical protein